MSAELVWDVEKANAGYGPKPVLLELTQQPRAGELVCLLGHNGAGKSTLLKVLYGLMPVRGGTLRYKGADVTSAGLAARLEAGIAYMPGGRGVFTQLTVAENLRLGLAAAKVPPANRDERLQDVFTLFP